MNARSCCTNCCTIASQNPLDCTKTAAQRLIFHNNIRKVGSFRNRQVTSSTLVVGSNITPILHSARFSPSYSYLNATMGSTLAARRAGM